MRLTARNQGVLRGANTTIPVPVTAQKLSLVAPVGGWDAVSPLANMPPQNAIELVNFFPQPGYIELRRGFVHHCDTGTGEPVETVMAYQGTDSLAMSLFAASGGTIYDVTTSTAAATTVTGAGSDRWQYTMFASGGGNVLWICNGVDEPLYYDGATWTTTAITGITDYDPEDIINVTPYRNRLWCVIKDSTLAVVLGTDAVTGAIATEFDVGGQFPRGGYLQAIGTWGTDVQDGPNEFIAFISNYGDVAVYQISDPTTAEGIAYLGTSQIGSPIGRRCVCPVGADLVLITIDGAVPLSQVLNYDRAAIQAAAITKNIRSAVTQAARDQGGEFGWQLISYARNTMAILNVPVAENAQQEQFVMNTVTGAWARFVGQNANCWEIFDNRAYFGDNDGMVMLADQGFGDQGQDMEAGFRTAFSYYNSAGTKQWTTIRPLITIDTTVAALPSIGINVDFGANATLSPMQFNDPFPQPEWNDPDTAVWDESQWSGQTDGLQNNWTNVSGLGYCASIRMSLTVSENDTAPVPRTLNINSFDVLYRSGGFI